jgi:quercetin dioxygenase-like cupin family protein
MYKVVLDNEHVRVLEFRAKAGEKEPMHYHPAAVVHVLSAGKARFTTPDGKSEERESTAGTVLWSDAVTHAYEYLGPGDAHVLIIELKGVPARKPPAEPGNMRH